MAAHKDGNENRRKDKFRKLAQIAGRCAVYAAVYGLLFAGIVSLCQKGYHFCYEVFGPISVQQEEAQEQAFQVEEGDTMQDISLRLKEEGLIAGQHSFYARAKLMGYGRKELQPGIYLLRADMDYGEIIQKLTASEETAP